MSEPQAFRVYRFSPQALDPITVYVEEYRPGASRITVQCYARAWTAYWGSHGYCPVEEFVCHASGDYVADSLKWGNQGLFLKRCESSDHDYLVRIVWAIQSEFRKALAEA